MSIYSKPLEDGLTIGPDYNMLYTVYMKLDAIRNFDDFSDVDITVGDSEITGVDLRDCIRYYAELDEKQENTSDYEQDEKECLYEIQIDPNRKLIIYTIRFSYTYGMEEIRNFDVYGYLLEK